MTGAEGRRVALGIALGAVLSLTPFLRYRWGAAHPTAHTDHSPRHGGVLGMVGDHHLEIVRAASVVECYASDAYRRPLAPVAGQVECGAIVTAAVVDGTRLVAPDRCATQEIACQVLLPGGVSVRMSADVRRP